MKLLLAGHVVPEALCTELWLCESGAEWYSNYLFYNGDKQSNYACHQSTHVLSDSTCLSPCDYTQDAHISSTGVTVDGAYLTIGNDSEVVQVLGYKVSRQPVEESIVPHQPHGGGADDEQGPLAGIAGSNADGLYEYPPYDNCTYYLL